MQVRIFRPTNRGTQLIGVEFIANNGNELDLYFSYNTIVAFRGGGFSLRVSQNHWSNTTGRHLNEIDGGRKEDRLDSTDFHRQLGEAYERFFNE